MIHPPYLYGGSVVATVTTPPRTHVLSPSLCTLSLTTTFKSTPSSTRLLYLLILSLNTPFPFPPSFPILVFVPSNPIATSSLPLEK